MKTINKSKQYTVTVGIPAFNEEANIISLLQSIIRQSSEHFVLDKIIVASDASTDQTENKVLAFAQKHTNVTLLVSKERKGKIARLNLLYQQFTSDFLLTLDADVVLAGTHDIDEMMKIMITQKHIDLVAAEQLPVSAQDTLISKILFKNYQLWNMVKDAMPDQANIYRMTGSVALLRKSFAKKVIYPTTITCDQGYLFVLAKRTNSFYFTKNATILQSAVATVKDLKKSHSRSFSERDDLKKVFGDEVMAYYALPFHIKLRVLMNALNQSPIITVAAALLNIYFKYFPYNDTLHTKGQWEIVSSTKKSIELRIS